VSERSEWFYQRRLRAVQLYRDGWLQKDIATALGVTRGAISQWIKKAGDADAEQLPQILAIKKGPGRPKILGPEDIQTLKELIAQGAEACGFVGDFWTVGRVRTLARRELGISADWKTFWHFLRDSGYSPQKPVVKAKQQNLEEVEKFKSGWVLLKKVP
jgi:transposase